jgi:site-specific DNA recombinase
VQAIMATNRSDRELGTNAEHPSLLAGLLVDREGRAMSPGHACKGVKRYRYYLTHQHHRSDAKAAPATRISAGDIEALVIDHIARSLQQHTIASLLSAASSAAAGAAASRWATSLTTAGPIDQRSMLLAVVRQISVGATSITIKLDYASLFPALGLPTPPLDEVASDDPLTIDVPFRLARAGKQMKLVVAGEAAAITGPDSPLTRLVVRAYAARTIWLKARGKDDAEIAARLGYSRAYLRTLLRIAFLAPDITAAILDGRQPIGLGENRLMRATHLPLDWAGQRQALGF